VAWYVMSMFRGTTAILVGRTRGTQSLALTLVIALAAGCSSEDEPPAPPPPPGAASTLDWNSLGYDLASTYWNRAEKKITTSTAPNLVKAWEFDTRASVSGTAVISGGRVYVAASPSDPGDPTKGGIIAIELATGTEIWRNQTTGGSSSLALDGTTLYLHDSGGTVRALDVGDGHEIWAAPTDNVGVVVGFSSPVVTKDFVLVGTSSAEELTLPAGNPATFHGAVLAYNKSDGSVAWKKPTVDPPGDGVGVWSTLSVDEQAGLVYASTGNNFTVVSDTSDAFLAIPLADGASFRWTAQMRENDVYTSRQQNGNPDADFGANPILFELQGRKLAAGGNKGGDVWVLDRLTGEVLKKRNLGPSSASRGGIFNNGSWDGSSLLFAVNGAMSQDPRSEPGPSPSTIFALDPATLDIKWERQIQGPSFSPITIANGVGFVGKNKTLQAFDTATGDVLFELATEGTLCAAPAISDGYVVFGSGMSWAFGGGTPGTKYYALKVP
jgi:polyvinyl alcohol dehydrogenase (cytochrome)